MLDFIRNHKRLTQIILLIFIIPSFIFVGIEGYKRFNNADGVVKIKRDTGPFSFLQKDYVITQQEWDNAVRKQVEMMRQQAAAQGRPFDAKLADSKEFKWQVLQQLVNKYVLQYAVSKENLSVPEQVVIDKIRQIPGLVDNEGNFDQKKYEQILAGRGLTPEGHVAIMGQEMSMQQVPAPIQFSVIPSKTVGRRVINLFTQEREVQKRVFSLASYKNQVSVTDEDLTNYYNDHAKQFTIPEHADIEIVVLDQSAAEKSVKITDSDLQNYYNQNKDRFATPEQRRAQHILILTPRNAKDADKEEARKKAEEILAQARANPSRFGELAKTYSQDPGSAKNGGDLGYFARGKMVKEFSDATFALQKGDVSDIVQTEYGFHIIMVTDIKPAVPKTLAQVRESVMQELKRAQVAKKYAEMSEAFSNMVYEKSDSLKPVADAMGLQIHTFKDLQRDPEAAAKQNPMLANPTLLEKIFSDDCVKGKHNTESVEIAPQVLVSARIAQHYPAALIPFEKVRAGIQTAVTNQKALVLAKEAGEAELANLKAGGAVTGFSAPEKVSRPKIAQSGRLDLAPVMKADASKLPAYVGVERPEEGYVIYRVTKVIIPEKIDPRMEEAMNRQMTGTSSAQELYAYVEYLRKLAGVEFLIKKPGEEDKK